MPHSLPEELLIGLSERVAAELGLSFPRERWRELESGVQITARALGVKDMAAWVRSLLSAPLSPAQVELLASELTIGETYFLREPRTFAAMAEQVLPELIRARRAGGRRLRIWSAGCSSGEEPYSIAILLDRLLPDLGDWQVTILATDINRQSLEKATAGVFGDWSFRGAPSWLKEGYFEPQVNGRLRLLPRLGNLVTFAYLNLAEDTYPTLANDTNAMDLIFCRNVLMYFAPEHAQRVVDNLHRSLAPNGWLVVSVVETSARLFADFVPVTFDGVVLYRKRDALAPGPVLPGQAPASSSTPFPPAATAVQPPLDVSANTAPQRAPASTAAQPATYEEALASSSTPFPADAALAPTPPRFEPPDAAAQPPAPSADDQPTTYEKALALYARGKYTQAAQQLTSGGSASDVGVEAAGLLARIHANLGDLEQARHWAERAIASDKINAASHYLRALILQEEGAIEEAVASLKRTLFLEPGFLLAHLALGNIARRRGRRREAQRHFASTLALLEAYGDDAALPHSDGLAAGRLREMIQSTRLSDTSA